MLKTITIDVWEGESIWTWEGEAETLDDAERAAVDTLNDDWEREYTSWDELASDMDGTAITQHPEVMAQRLPLRTVELYRRLADGLSDMVEEGRLSEADCENDYAWLVDTLAKIAGADPGTPTPIAAQAPSIPAAVAALQTYCADAPAIVCGEGYWDDQDSACGDGMRQSQSDAAQLMREALGALGFDAPAGVAVCEECFEPLSEEHNTRCSRADEEDDECATCADATETRAAPCDECGHMDGEEA